MVHLPPVAAARVDIRASPCYDDELQRFGAKAYWMFNQLAHQHGLIASRSLSLHRPIRCSCVVRRMPADKNVFLSISSDEDLKQRRKERNLREVIESGKKLGLSDEATRNNCRVISSLLPDLELCNPDKMKASDWAKVLTRPEAVATVLVALKKALPTANVSSVIAKCPKLLLETPSKLQSDIDEVKLMLNQEGLDDQMIGDLVESVPDLIKPASLIQSLANLNRWLPNQSAKEILTKSPQLLLNVDEADLEANPQYGENSYFFVDREWAPEVQNLPSLPSD